MTLMIFH